MEGDGFSLFLYLVGSGRGPGARVRRWSAIVFILMLIMGGIAFYTKPRKADAADAEAGKKPLPATRIELYVESGTRGSYSTRWEPIPYEIKGRLLDSDAVTVTWRGERWIYAPLVSEHSGSTDSPHLYFGAPEASYRRSRAENRYVGMLERDISRREGIRIKFQEAGLSPSSDAYFLEDNGTQRAAADRSLSFILFALVGGVVSLVVFLMALRRARPDDDADASSLASHALPDRPNYRT